jgi:HD-GYP domain-containing protein (c-di-GMP phosphodiesterase class II)
VPQLREMLPGIELHHEALNGRGSPYGLKGDEIPLLARVIAVGDTFDALTTNRPYQQAHDPVEALRIIQSLSGQRLDPQAVAALLAVFERGEIRIQKQPIHTVPLESGTPAPAALQLPPHSLDPLTVETTRT